MKYTWLVIGIIVLSGCVSVEKNRSTSSMPVESRKHDLTQINMVHTGMSMDEVKSIMGDSLKVGFIANEDQTFSPITVEQPYRQETIENETANYQIYYYIVKVDKADGMVAEDELDPLIFQDEKLVAKGWDALYGLKRDMGL